MAKRITHGGKICTIFLTWQLLTHRSYKVM
jgi:hypothetical protein